jgi:hypothetical protein
MVTGQPTHPEPQGADADLPLDPIGFDHDLEGLAVSIGGGRWPYRSARPIEVRDFGDATGFGQAVPMPYL